MLQTQNQLSTHILSKPRSEEFARFFLNILREANQYHQEDNACPVFVVVTSNRCLAMFSSYLRILCETTQDPDAASPSPWKSCNPDELQILIATFRSCVITSSAAWSMAYDMTQHYLETGTFPHLFVVDELPLHGRALTGFLYGLEKRLLHAETLYMEKFGAAAKSRAPIQEVFLDKLHISVVHQLAGASVLLPRYQRILTRDNPLSTELPLQTWRDYSIAYTQYASICGAHLIGRSFGFPVPEVRDHPIEATANSMFTKVCTRLQGIKQETWLYFYPSADHPQVICAVCCQPDHNKGSQTMCVPYIILNHISWDSLLSLHNRLAQEAQTSGKRKLAAFLSRLEPVLEDTANSEPSLLTAWIVQTTDLVLSTWLLKRFLRDVKGVSQDELAEAWLDSVDLEPLICNFRIWGPTDQVRADILSALQELWTWEPTGTLEEYLAVYTTNGQPISATWMGANQPAGDTELDENSPLVQCVEDTLSKISLEAERNAYTLYGSGLSFSDEAMSNWGDIHSMSTLLEKLHTQAETYIAVRGPLNLYETTAILLQAMDLGLLGMSTVFVRQQATKSQSCWRSCTDWNSYNSSPGEVYTWLRAGEAALFLLPIRYRNLLPVLDEIQEKRKEDLEGAAFDLNRFVDSLDSGDSQKPIRIANDLFVPVNQLKRSLCIAYELFVLGGQKFKEWECGLHDRRLPAKIQIEVNESDRRLRMYFLSTYRNP